MAIILNRITSAIQEQSHRPYGENWMGNEWISVPHELEDKARRFAPYCILIFTDEQLTDIEGLEKPLIEEVPQTPTVEEMIMLAIAELDAQREIDKLETQLAIAELTETILGGI